MVRWDENRTFDINSTLRIWKKKKDEYSPKNIVPTVKLEGRKIMCRRFSANGTGRLHCVEERMDEVMYHQLLGNNLLPSKTPVKMDHGRLFQLHNGLRPTAKATKSLSMWFSWFYLVYVSRSWRVPTMKITELSILCKWENSQNWWCIKYLFSQLYILRIDFRFKSSE